MKLSLTNEALKSEKWAPRWTTAEFRLSECRSPTGLFWQIWSKIQQILVRKIVRSRLKADSMASSVRLGLVRARHSQVRPQLELKKWARSTSTLVTWFSVGERTLPDSTIAKNSTLSILETSCIMICSSKTESWQCQIKYLWNSRGPKWGEKAEPGKLNNTLFYINSSHMKLFFASDAVKCFGKLSFSQK